MYHSTNITTDNLLNPMEKQIGLLISSLWFSIREYDGQAGINERAGDAVDKNMPRRFITKDVLKAAKVNKIFVPSTAREYQDVWLELVHLLCHWEKLAGRKAPTVVPVSDLEMPPRNIPD